MLSRRTALALGLLAGIPTVTAWASPIEIPVDMTQSTVSVTYCLGASCSTDTSPVVGESVIKLDAITAPTLVELHDFSYSLTETVLLTIPGLTITGANMAIDYATPGLPQLPAALGVGGAFTILDVPADQSGLVNYTATGGTCYLLTLSSYPCVGMIDLSQQGTQVGDYAGTVTNLPNRGIRFEIEPNITGPVNPDNPALGTLTITGSVVGQVSVPLRADADLNGMIDGRDVGPFVDVLLNPAIHTWQQRFAVDMNDDDAFDLNDAVLFVDCLVNGNCAE